MGMGMGMMWEWEETWELHGKWECRYGNAREWERGTHSRYHLYPEEAAPLSYA